MEDERYLNDEDKKSMEVLKKELTVLKAEHKNFAGRKNKISPEEREKWKKNGTRMNEVYIAIKDLRFKNVLEAGK